MYLIAGLGNPGLKYKNTRHNAGFMALDLISKEARIKVVKRKFDALTGMGYIGNEQVLLCKPNTYMNLSGYALVAARDYYNIPTSNIIVIYDDVDIEPGKLRLRVGGSAGSHNGMKSIILELADDNFTRIRIGIGRQPEYMELKNFVLGKAQKEQIAIQNAANAAVEILKNGVAAAQGKYN